LQPQSAWLGQSSLGASGQLPSMFLHASRVVAAANIAIDLPIH
jgi:hypothetical protein